MGLGLSLVLNAIFFAGPLNKMELLTLPDLMRVKFGPLAEVFFSVLTIVSFLFLLAGNLVGAGRIVNFLFDLGDVPGVWICCAAVWMYTVAGGLFSVAYTDIVQAIIGWLGLIVGTSWVLNNMPTHPGVSPAYPLGDKAAHLSGIADSDSYDPIPNALMFNWATIIVLGFGNLGALDFQVPTPTRRKRSRNPTRHNRQCNPTRRIHVRARNPTRRKRWCNPTLVLGFDRSIPTRPCFGRRESSPPRPPRWRLSVAWSAG